MRQDKIFILITGTLLILFSYCSTSQASPPTLDFATYLGGGEPVNIAFLGEDIANGVALDHAGNVYVTGIVGSKYGYLSPGDRSSGDFPITKRIGSWTWVNIEVFLTKFSPTGELLASVLIGGKKDEEALDLALDGSGNIYLTGWTASPDFPLLNEYQSYPDGSTYHAFVTKLDPNFQLLYSTILAGTSRDSGYGIFADDAGQAYVTGGTYSTDFPTKGALMVDPDGDREDAWVAKLDTTLEGDASLVYSTYLDGSGEGRGNKIAADSTGNAYVTVTTKAPDFPLRNQYMSHPGGCLNVVVAKLNPAGDDLLYSTYLGRTLINGSGDIAANDDGHVYVTGMTSWDLFPTRHAYKDTMEGVDAFLARLNTNLSGDASLVYSTFLGGTGLDEGHSIAVNSAGKVHVTGWTNCTDFPLREFSPPRVSGDFDIFLAKFDTALMGDDSLIWSTYFGGTDEDVGRAVAISVPGGLAVAGVTLSPDLPVTASAFQTTHANVDSYDAFVMKFSESTDITIPLPDIPTITYYPPLYFSVVRPDYSECQPIGSPGITKTTLHMQVGLPKFKPPADLYLALYGSDDPIPNNTGNNQSLPFSEMYFINAQGQLQQSMTPWKTGGVDPVSQFLAVDVNTLKLHAPYCNLAVIAQASSGQMVKTLGGLDLQNGYYAWITQIPTPRKFPWAMFIPAFTDKK